MKFEKLNTYYQEMIKGDAQVEALKLYGSDRNGYAVYISNQKRELTSDEVVVLSFGRGKSKFIFCKNGELVKLGEISEASVFEDGLKELLGITKEDLMSFAIATNLEFAEFKKTSVNFKKVEKCLKEFGGKIENLENMIEYFLILEFKKQGDPFLKEFDSDELGKFIDQPKEAQMKNTDELVKQAQEIATRDDRDIAEIYHELSGTEFVEYSDELLQKLEKAGYKLFMKPEADNSLIWLSVDGKEKEKALPYQRVAHIFTRANIIKDMFAFSKAFIKANYPDADVSWFENVEKKEQAVQELKARFGILDIKETNGGFDDERELAKFILENIPNIKPNEDSVPFGDKNAILTSHRFGEDAHAELYITKEPMAHETIKEYKKLVNETSENLRSNQ